MTQIQTSALLYILIVIARYPRIKERWVTPLMRGQEWFFDVGVAPDSLEGPGAALLRYYRWRLFIPWAIEGVILTALWLTGNVSSANLLMLIMGITLFTRFNYYAARIATENRARSFEVPDSSPPASNVVLSLEPRTLRGYTKWWVEAGIAFALSAAVAWLVYLTNTSLDGPLYQRLIGMLIMNVYIQAGLLLVKLGIIGSNGAAPADNVEQYLVWRESLRRWTTGICDVLRLMMAITPLLALSIMTGGFTRLTAAILCGTGFLVALGHEWRSRLAHLAVARRTKPARFPLLPDAQKTRGPVCFWPSLPVLLLRTANGYALNLASAPVRIAGLYFAGFAGLWLWLAR